ncbi:aminopeptidase N [Thalassotalea sp. LPB0316]|uniref:aminopeptidase N n=1 Tax=Thalassotalea sp. LPB0316 TaxID=2769490 RepID=UPI0018692B87|nr:aminopeptidase N [Thalassotalea sp. LPB0316]QOL24996.1 aminopeptidase N [Thalassotalea sp. LPB0316]
MTDSTTRYLSDYQAPQFNISTVNLSFELEDSETRVVNEMQITRLSGETKLVLDGEHLTLIRVELNGEQLSPSQYQLTDSTLTLSLVEKESRLLIETQIDPINNTALEGLFKSGGAFCTQCEAEGFRRITYYLDRPDVMATFTTKVIADQATYPQLLANGNKIESGTLANGKHFVTWHDPYPKPAYLFALVAGDFDLLRDSYTTIQGRDVALEIFVDKGNLSKAHHAMNSLKKSMQWDEEVFGLAYDLDIYMIVAVDFFNMGAMENKGLNVFNSKYVLANEETATDTDYFNVEAVIAHEYFHNWTGNRVTCRDWFQLSLKEGLTVFRDQQFSADMHSGAVTRIQNVRVLRAHQFAEDASPMAHPIRPEKVMEMNNFYTLTVYEKGAEVIRMIHTLLGQDNFRKGMDLYFERFDGMAVTCDDFVNAMADASNKDLSLFKRWYSQSGTPMLTVKESYDASSQQYVIEVAQKTEPTKQQPEKLALHIPIKIELLDTDTGKTQTHLLELTQESQSWTFNGFTTKPVMAFLGDFSAPVKVTFDQSDDELIAIMKQANNTFCQWDAGQKLFMRYIFRLIETPNYQLPEQLINTFEAVLDNPQLDDALKAEQLTLPSFGEVADNMSVIEPEKILAALKILKQFLASGLHEALTTCYQRCQQAEPRTAQTRALASTCLSYLALHSQAQPLVEAHYYDGQNMTEHLAALNAVTHQDLACRSQLMSDFEQKWFDTTLVMDKWYSLQAMQQGDQVFENLADLLKRSDFSLTNPNRARSLLGAFSMNNPKYFHCASGRGYEFLTTQLIELNTINPQVASRLITPLLAFKQFEPQRQAMMKAQLVKVRGLDNLSKDLTEKINAALD